MPNKTKIVANWDELISFIENINPYQKTIVLTGFINEVKNGKVNIRELAFTTTSVKILKQVHSDETNQTDY